MENNTTHICKYCNAETSQPDEQCYANPNNTTTMNKQQTAVEWLIEQLEEKGELRETPSIRIVQLNIDTSDYLDLKRQAREMEKEQIMDAYSKGADDEYNLDWNPLDRRDSIDCEQYYKETYEN
jgi:hypothetical protein